MQNKKQGQKMVT